MDPDRQDSETATEQPPSDKPGLLLFSNCSVQNFATFLPRTKALGDKLRTRWFFIGRDKWSDVPEDELARVEIVWEMVHGAYKEVREEMNVRLPKRARRIKFPALTTSSLWPLFVFDKTGRVPYGHGDRAAMTLRNELDLRTASDDEIYERYLEVAAQRLVGLQRLFDVDRQTIRQRDTEADVKFADFIEENFRVHQLFSQGGRITRTTFEALLMRMIAATFDSSWCDTVALEAEAQALVHDYAVTDWEELPVSPLVADRLQLTWYDPDRSYRWHGHRWTFREWVVAYIRAQPFLH